MDPNETLRQLREAIAELRRLKDGDSNDAEIEAGHQVAEYAEALDQWMSNGGYRPADWRPVIAGAAWQTRRQPMSNGGHRPGPWAGRP